MMLSALKRIFSFDGAEVDLSRRKFIRDAATLTALAVTASTSPQLAQQLFESIEKQMASGVVEGQTFWLTEPVVIDMPGVVIRNCRFIATRPMPYMFYIGSDAQHCILDGCYLEDNGFLLPSGACVTVEPQIGDMTRTLQSAFDLAQSNSGPATIQLPQGKYRLASSPIVFNGGRVI